MHVHAEETAPHSTSDIIRAFYISHLYLHKPGGAAAIRAYVSFLHSNPFSSCARAASVNIHPTASRGHHSMSWGPPVTDPCMTCSECPVIFLTIYCTSVKASDPNPLFEVIRDLRQETLSISSQVHIKTTAPNALASCQYNVFSQRRVFASGALATCYSVNQSRNFNLD